MAKTDLTKPHLMRMGSTDRYDVLGYHLAPRAELSAAWMRRLCLAKLYYSYRELHTYHNRVLAM
jgi:hypothetical protein